MVRGLQSVTKSYDFFKLVLDSLPNQIVVIDSLGEIVFSNKVWDDVAKENGSELLEWRGINYLSVCENAALTGDEISAEVSVGIQAVMNGKQPSFYYEYPCHGINEKRWFMMRVVAMHYQANDYFLITHHNITERKLSEEAVRDLSRIDALTSIANRRYFNTFFKAEWRRCLRSKLRFTLAMVDIDHFKLLNDTYGHQKGDEVLIQFAAVLNDFCRRPGDLCARYGGEEFALIWTDIDHEEAVTLAEDLLTQVESLEIANEHSPTKPILTTSIGLVSVYPQGMNELEILAEADELLYEAKQQGRNRLVANKLT